MKNELFEMIYNSAKDYEIAVYEEIYNSANDTDFTELLIETTDLLYDITREEGIDKELKSLTNKYLDDFAEIMKKK